METREALHPHGAHGAHDNGVSGGRDADRLVDGLLEGTRLKALDRAGWVLRGVPGPESVAAHSWGVSWLVLALLPRGLDRGRALAYAALHDLAEVRVGDLTPADDVSAGDKRRREAQALTALVAPLGPARAEELAATWRRYEAQEDPEGRFVRQLDRLDMALQALSYAERGAGSMGEFVSSAAEVVEDPALVGLLDVVARRVRALGDAERQA